jgi:hypothetical protein
MAAVLISGAAEYDLRPALKTFDVSDHFSFHQLLLFFTDLPGFPSPLSANFFGSSVPR